MNWDERWRCYHHVSPTSIRSRILKAPRILKKRFHIISFTHVDPFEDTERATQAWCLAGGVIRFTHVDPFEDTESDLKLDNLFKFEGFTHVDPFEDTERYITPPQTPDSNLFHPRRSVRGY